MKRLFRLAGLLFVTLVQALAQEQVNVAQHGKLPLLAKEIVFQKYQARLDGQQQLNFRRDPGVWRDVRLVDWSPPIATISGGWRTGTDIRTDFVHIMSFPAALRPKLSELAPQAKAARDKKDGDALVLKDGRRLDNVSLLWAVPYLIHVSHAGGEEDISLQVVESSYSGRHGLTSDSVYYHQFTFADGTVLTSSRIVATSPDAVRIMHSAGSMAGRLQDLPTEVASLVSEHLIAKGIFRDESLSAMSRSQKEWAENKPARVAATPRPTAEPTPKPDLIRKKEPFQYAQIPLSDGKRILHNVTILSFGKDSVETTEGTVRPQDLPPEVIADLGGIPYHLLQKLVTSGLVARARSPIFESIRNPNAEKPFADATGGRMFGHVGTGFISLSNLYRNYDGAVVTLPKPLTDKSEAFILVRDFYHIGANKYRKWWNESERIPVPEMEKPWAITFSPCALSDQSILLDAPEGKYTLFGNERGTMLRAWRIGGDAWSSYHIVETAQGYFLGRLSSREEVKESTMTWPQLVSHQSMPFALQKTSQRAIKPGQAIIRVTDSDASSQSALTSFDPANSQITSAHYRRLIEQGLPGLLVRTEIPQSDGVEMSTSGEGSKDFSIVKDSQIFRIVLDYVSETESTLLLKYEIQNRERTVERSRENGRVIVKEGPWKNTKKESFVELAKDPDGGVRLTDGQRIYEILPDRVSDTQVITYEVKANTLNKNTR